MQDPQGRALLDYNGTSGSGGTILNWYAFGRGANEALAQVNSTTRATLIPDSLGSIIATLDASTGTLTKAGFQPYGESGTTAGTFRYTGARIDAETNGLYNMRARIYSPVLGRFMQTDPSGTNGGPNLYAYVGNDPLNNVDSSGLAAESGGGGNFQNVASSVSFAPETTAETSVQSSGGPPLISAPATGGGGGASSPGGSSIILAMTQETPGQAQEEGNEKQYEMQRSLGAETDSQDIQHGEPLNPAIGAPAFPVPLLGQSFGKLGTGVANPGLNITGFTKHGVNQAINNNVSPGVLLGTVRNPSVVLPQSAGQFLFLSGQASVVLTPTGTVITTYSSRQFDTNIRAILNLVPR